MRDKRMSRLIAPSLFTIALLTAVTAASAQEETAPPPAADNQVAITPADFQLAARRHSNRVELPAGLAAELLKVPRLSSQPALTVRHIGKDTVEQATADGTIKIRSS